MKNLFIIAVVSMMFTSCSNDSEDNPLPAYTVEGKWLWSPDPDDRTYVNTMFEFVDGNVYTSYGVNCGWEDNFCTDADFNALDASDRIPGTEAYRFEDFILTIDGIAQTIAFRCDGGILVFENGGILWKLSSDCQ